MTRAPARPPAERLVGSQRYWLPGAAVLATGAGCAAGIRAASVDLDDGDIVYRYVDNLAAGAGWHYNLSEKHNACTSVLHPVLVTVIRLVVGSASLAEHVLGTASLIAAGLFAALLLRRAGAPLAGLAVALLVPLGAPLNSTWGLETSLLVAVLLGGAVVSAAQGTRARSAEWVLRGLAALTRPDAGLWWVTGALRTRRERGAWPVRGLLIAVALQVPWWVFASVEFGSPLPASLGNKLGQGRSAAFGAFGYWRGLRAAVAGLSSHRVLVAAIVLGAGWGVVTAVRRRQWALVELAAFLGALQVLYIAASVPAYPWYFVPALTMLLIFPWLGLDDVVRRAGRQAAARGGVRPAGLRATAAAAVLLTAACAGVVGLSFTALRDVPNRLAGREQVYLDAAAWLRAHGLTGSVAAAEVGVLGHAMPRQTEIIDLVGLVSATPAYYLGHDNDDFFSRYPQAVVLHWSLAGGVSDPGISRMVAQAASAARLTVHGVALKGSGRGGVLATEQAVAADPRFAVRYRLASVLQRAGSDQVLLFVRSSATTRSGS